MFKTQKPKIFLNQMRSTLNAFKPQLPLSPNSKAATFEVNGDFIRARQIKLKPRNVHQLKMVSVSTQKVVSRIHDACQTQTIDEKQVRPQEIFKHKRLAKATRTLLNDSFNQTDKIRAKKVLTYYKLHLQKNIHPIPNFGLSLPKRQSVSPLQNNRLMHKDQGTQIEEHSRRNLFDAVKHSPKESGQEGLVIKSMSLTPTNKQSYRST
jgi:hypothetical protein